MKKGFSLIELAIVFVVIGGMFSVALVAISIKDAANLHSMARSLSQYKIAVEIFKSEYRSLPGDTRLFSNPGNNDNEVIDWSTVEFYNGINKFKFNGEVANFWKHLSESGFETSQNSSFSNDASSGIKLNENIPELFDDAGIFGVTFSDRRDF